MPDNSRHIHGLKPPLHIDVDVVMTAVKTKKATAAAKPKTKDGPAGTATVKKAAKTKKDVTTTAKVNKSIHAIDTATEASIITSKRRMTAE